MSKSKVWLIGAGPGDPGLISVKGLKYLQQADVVIYDRLVNEKLLNNAKKDAEIIYVGKEANLHSVPQDKINEILVQKAKENKIVVRLKGGDPFIFGRGGEECLALAENGIEFEVVPGITAAIGASAYAGIPLTHRTINSTLAFITGHEDPTKETSSIAWDKISTGIETIVFFMGVKNLPKIVNNLIENGRDKNTPVAVIHAGTLPDQKVVKGTLETIVATSRHANIKPPSLIIVGDVVNLGKQLNWFESKPLFGQKIIVTRSRTQASKLVDLLEYHGAEAIELPTIKIEDPDDLDAVDECIERIDEYRWIIFTSTNGVQYFFKRFFALNKDIRDLGKIKIACMGSATGEEVEKFHLKVDFIPSKYASENFTDEFLSTYNVKGRNILLARTDIATQHLEKELIIGNANVTSLTVYKTLQENSLTPDILSMIENNEIDWVTFTSSSTARNFFNMYKGDKNFKIASIGPVTTETVKEYGYCVDIQAQEYTIPGLVESLLNQTKKKT